MRIRGVTELGMWLMRSKKRTDVVSEMEDGYWWTDTELPLSEGALVKKYRKYSSTRDRRHDVDTFENDLKSRSLSIYRLAVVCLRWSLEKWGAFFCRTR